MNEEGLRHWLGENYRLNTVQTKMSEARQLDRAYGDLDAHYDADRLEAVMETLRYSASDKAESRPNPSKVPLTSDLYRDLGNLRTTVNYYRRFRGEGGTKRPDVEAVNKAIDECAAIGVDEFLESYGFGKSIDYWVLRDGDPPTDCRASIRHAKSLDGLDALPNENAQARQNGGQPPYLGL